MQPLFPHRMPAPGLLGMYDVGFLQLAVIGVRCAFDTLELRADLRR